MLIQLKRESRPMFDLIKDKILDIFCVFIIMGNTCYLISSLVTGGWDGIVFFFSVLNSYIGFMVTIQILREGE